MNITTEQIKKLIQTVDAGLVSGLGDPEPGRMCIEAAACYALGLPHGDDPGCVAPALRALKIALNDSIWSSDSARAAGLRKLAVLQLGSKGAIDEAEFVCRVVMFVGHTVLPRALRAASFEEAAVNCEAAETLADVERTARSARATATRATAAATATATATATAEATATATRATAAAAEVAKWAAARAAWAEWAAARAATATATRATAAAAAAATATAAAAATAWAAEAATRAATAAAAEATAAAATRAAAATANKLARDAELQLFADGVAQILIDMRVPGVQWLPLLEQ